MSKQTTGSAVEILYNGKDFRTLEKAKVGDEDKLTTYAMAQDIEAALSGLKSEIEAAGGSVIIDIKGPTMFQMAIQDLPEKLSEKVRKALTPG